MFEFRVVDVSHDRFFDYSKCCLVRHCVAASFVPVAQAAVHDKHPVSAQFLLILGKCAFRLFVPVRLNGKTIPAAKHIRHIKI